MVDAPRFHPRGQQDLAPSGQANRARANMAALTVLRAVQADGRPATPEEQQVLARWSGWGALPLVFDTKPTLARFDSPEAYQRAVQRWETFSEVRAQVRELLTDAEWTAGSRTTLNAHYTDAVFVREIWDAVREMGFDGGTVLEPGSGLGNFIGLAPEVTHPVRMTGVERDPTTAAISQLLYPDAAIVNSALEDIKLPKDAFDAAVGNVPFGRFQPYDPQYNPDRALSIHDLFVVKALASTRPTGVVALITSRYTLDAQDPTARQRLHELGDLLGAVRLPTAAHSAAAGTDVVTDVLFLRRRTEHEQPGDDRWLATQERVLAGREEPVRVNAYFEAHPDHVLGRMQTRLGQFGPELTVIGTHTEAEDIAVQLRTAARAITATLAAAEVPPATAATRERDTAAAAVLPASGAEGSLALDAEGTITIVDGGRVVPLDVHPEQRDRLVLLVDLKQKVQALYDAEAATSVPGETVELAALRGQVREAYRAYRRRYPPLSKPRQNLTFTPKEAAERARREGLDRVPAGWRQPTAFGWIDDDPDASLLFSLDRWDDQAGAAIEQPILTRRMLEPRGLPDRADGIEEAIALAMEHDGGMLDMGRVAALLGVDVETAVQQVGALAFRNPYPDRQPEGGPPVGARWEPRSQYLSGDVRTKLEQAREAAKSDPAYAANVAALEQVQPTDLTPSEIKARVGAPWIPATDYTQFLRDLGFERAEVRHAGGTMWEVKGADFGDLATSEWGTPQRHAQSLFEALLQQAESTIRITYRDAEGSTLVDQPATDAAREKAKLLATEFEDWVWRDPDRADRLARIYNDTFNRLVLPEYDPSGLTLPGALLPWPLRPHQNAAVRRIVSSPTVLLGHVVGAGKTATMVAGAMELRRTGLARKPAMVVPNHMLKQITREFRQLYPTANLLAINASDLHHRRRAKFMARIAGGEWDAVILTHEAFNRIPVRPSTERAYMDGELVLLRQQLDTARENGMSDRTLKQIENTLANAESRIKEQLDKTSEEGVFFEDTGIDYLFLDEAHAYKNLRTVSAIPGATIQGSNKATKLHMVLEYLRSQSSTGRVATLATGTPIANSVTEAYVLKRYMDPQMLESMGLKAFDNWAATFGEVVTQIEPDPKGVGYKQKSRFARFFNVPELMRAYRSFADVQLAEDLKLPTPPVRKEPGGQRGEVVLIPSTQAQRDFFKSLPNQPWINDDGGVLKALGLGLRASIDMRLVGRSEEEGSKLDSAAEQIAQIWAEHKDVRYPVSATDPTPQELPGALQLVFLDEGTPGSSSQHPVDLYADLRDKLAELGVPREQIRFIHEASNDVKKEKLFADARAGRVAVLIGSTEKMGTGTNVQSRAVALHHLSYPWRPADMAQRDGRIERQGNLNDLRIPGTPDDVRILYYVTERSFDEFRLNHVTRKAKFIGQLQRRDFNVREIEDIGEEAVNLGLITALSSGDPAIMEHAQAMAERARLQGLARSWDRDQDRRARHVADADLFIGQATAALTLMRTAAQTRTPTVGDAFTITLAGVRHTKRDTAATALGRTLADIAKDTTRRPGQRIPLGTLGGQDFHAEIAYGIGGTRMVRLRFAWGHVVAPGNRTDRAQWPANKIDSGTGRGALQALEKWLNQLDSDIVKLDAEVQQQRQQRAETAANVRDKSANPYRALARSKESEEQLLGRLIIANEKETNLAERAASYSDGEVPDSLAEELTAARATTARLRQELTAERQRQHDLSERELQRSTSAAPTPPAPSASPPQTEPAPASPEPTASPAAQPQRLEPEAATVDEAEAQDEAEDDRAAAPDVADNSLKEPENVADATSTVPDTAPDRATPDAAGPAPSEGQSGPPAPLFEMTADPEPAAAPPAADEPDIAEEAPPSLEPRADNDLATTPAAPTAGALAADADPPPQPSAVPPSPPGQPTPPDIDPAAAAAGRRRPDWRSEPELRPTRAGRAAIARLAAVMDVTPDPYTAETDERDPAKLSWEIAAVALERATGARSMSEALAAVHHGIYDQFDNALRDRDDILLRYLARSNPRHAEALYLSYSQRGLIALTGLAYSWDIVLYDATGTQVDRFDGDHYESWAAAEEAARLILGAHREATTAQIITGNDRFVVNVEPEVSPGEPTEPSPQTHTTGTTRPDPGAAKDTPPTPDAAPPAEPPVEDLRQGAENRRPTGTEQPDEPREASTLPPEEAPPPQPGVPGVDDAEAAPAAPDPADSPPPSSMIPEVAEARRRDATRIATQAHQRWSSGDLDGALQLIEEGERLYPEDGMWARARTFIETTPLPSPAAPDGQDVEELRPPDAASLDESAASTPGAASVSPAVPAQPAPSDGGAQTPARESAEASAPARDTDAQVGDGGPMPDQSAAVAEPVAGPWSARIRIDASVPKPTVAGTSFEDTELRAALRPKFKWRKPRQLWEYIGSAADKDAAVDAIRAKLAELDRAATEQAAAKPSFPPTAQQQAIIDATLAGQNVAVQALAGTGKTSTLRMVADAVPDKRILYIAFNKSIAQEARQSMGGNVTALTFNSLALRQMRGGPYATKLDRLGKGGVRHPQDIAKLLNVDPVEYLDHDGEPQQMAAGGRAQLAKAVVAKFRESADPQITHAHLPDALPSTALAAPILETARQIWDNIADPDNAHLLDGEQPRAIEFGHDDYFKLWALSRPRIDTDLIFFDEAQDINDVQRDVVQSQPTQTVVVGDTYQSIYGFRGAKDALKDWPADITLPLTQSWRFGPAIAERGDDFLRLLDAPFELTGNPALNSTIGIVDDPDAVLCRTNVGAVAEVFRAFDDGKRVALVGGGDEISRLARAARDLKAGRGTNHPELSRFTHWWEVEEAAQDERALQSFVRLIDQHGPDRLLSLVGNLVDEDAVGEFAPDVVVSTAHKAKGREWDRVRIAADFHGPKYRDSGELESLPAAEELRLSYVAVTRGRLAVELGSLAWIEDVVAAAPARDLESPAVAVTGEAAPAQPSPAPATQPTPAAPDPVAETPAEASPTEPAQPAVEASTPAAPSSPAADQTSSAAPPSAERPGQPGQQGELGTDDFLVLDDAPTQSGQTESSQADRLVWGPNGAPGRPVAAGDDPMLDNGLREVAQALTDHDAPQTGDAPETTPAAAAEEERVPAPGDAPDVAEDPADDPAGDTAADMSAEDVPDPQPAPSVRHPDLQEAFALAKWALADYEQDPARTDDPPALPTPAPQDPARPSVAGVEDALARPLAEAQAELGEHARSGEWRRIAEIAQASRMLGATIKGAAGSYRREVWQDVRVQGFYRAFTARCARTIAWSANSLANALDRGSRLAIRALRKLGRAANDYADRLRGNLPPDRSLQTSADLKRSWSELNEMIPPPRGTSRFEEMLDQPAPSTPDAPSRLTTLLESSMGGVRQAFGTANAALHAARSSITATPAWQRLAALWNGAAAVVDKVHQGALRFERDAFAMGFLSAVWTRTCETISWGARQAMEHLADNDRIPGAAWQALRLLHHTAEESIAHLRDQLPRGQHAPLGTYDSPSIAEAATRAVQNAPVPQPEPATPAHGPAAAPAPTAQSPVPDRAAVYQEMMEVLDVIDLARQHGELKGGFAEAAKLTTKAAERMGLERFGAPGDAFDPHRHDGVGLVNPDREPTNNVIAVQVLRPGYIVGGQVIRPASVMVGEPKDLNPEAQQARDLMAACQPAGQQAIGPSGPHTAPGSPPAIPILVAPHQRGAVGR